MDGIELVVMLVVEESHGTILSMKITRFCRFMKRCNGHTDGRTYGRTYGWTDERTNRPSYRDARTHLKLKIVINFFPMRTHQNTIKEISINDQYRND